MAKISYLVTVHNEAKELSKLLSILHASVENTDDEIVILDDFSTDEETRKVLELHSMFSTSSTMGKVVSHKLDGNFAAHKNYGNLNCKHEWIFQIDADEYPAPFLLENLRDILDSNPNVELFRLPRVNIVRGATAEDAKKWGWNMRVRPEGYTDLPIVNWEHGDRQGRIYRNKNEILWSRKLHEVIVGAKVVAELPLNPNFALVHDKTIEKQTSQNEFYTKNWSRNENMGISE